MIDGARLVLTVVAALGCGLAAGVFFAFSTFVMQGLSRLPAAEGIAAMQSINVTAVRPAFMTALFGTALACVALIVVALAALDEPYAVHLLVGSGLYLVGTIALTGIFHVPRNDELDRLDPSAPDAAEHWARYLRAWTAGNHLRTASALAAAAVLTVALRAG